MKTCKHCNIPFYSKYSRQVYCGSKTQKTGCSWEIYIKRGNYKSSKNGQKTWAHSVVGKEYMKKYRKKNREKINKYSSKWISDHREYYNNYAVKTRQQNPVMRLNHSMSTAVRIALTSNIKKGCKWEQLLGYTRYDLKHHLEKQFVYGMGWDNYGSVWHIDHKTPQSWFNYSSIDDVEFKKCWALENLQPMFAEDNMIKGNRWKNE